MIVLRPDTVTLGSHTLDSVQAVAFEREARRLVVEYSDFGAYAAFADVPEVRVIVRITRRVTRSEADALKPGDKLTLTVRTAPGLSAAGTQVVTAQVVLTDISWSTDARSGAGATQRISAVAVSSDGDADPVSITAATSEV